MNKKIQIELRSLAKRILNANENVDAKTLKSLVAQLYEKITVLEYLDSNQESTVYTTSEKANVKSSLDSKSYREENWFQDPKPVPQSPYSDEIAEPLIEKIKDIVAQIPQESQQVDDFLNEILPKKETHKNELEDFASHYHETPVFERKEPITENSDTPPKPVSLNEKLDQGLNIGLNDRHAFVKHLFGNNQDDYSRVLSQINTMSTFEEAEVFIKEKVKPDYNDWIDKEEYSYRFMTIIEKRFL